jgi:hypothetical protein
MRPEEQAIVNLLETVAPEVGNFFFNQQEARVQEENEK